MGVCCSRVQEIENKARVRPAMIARYLAALNQIVAAREEKLAQVGGAK